MSASDYTRQIASLIEQQGAARARAAEQSGQVWGGALANLGQIPLQVQQQQRLKAQQDLQTEEVRRRTQQFGLEADKAKREEADRVATRTALHDAGGDLEKAIPAIMQTNPEVGLKLTEALREQKSADLKAKSALLDYHSKINNAIADHLGPVADATDPESQQKALDSAHATLKQMGIPTDDLPMQAGPDATAKAAALRQGTMSAKEQLAAKQKALEDQVKSLEQASREKDRLADNERQAAQAKATAEYQQGMLKNAGRQADAAVTRANRPPSADNNLVRVEHKGADGKTVIEFLPKSEVRGKTFEKGTGAVTENRLTSAAAVNKVGEDMITKLSDPDFAKRVGPLMGRANTLRDFIGNPPLEFSELAGEIESYALATMGVHGMRSVVGAQQVQKLLDAHHTPESLAATLKGLNKFANQLMEDEGRKNPEAAASTGKKRTRYDMNGMPIKE